MWYPAATTVAPADDEPVTVSEAKAQANIESSDDDTLVTRLILTARAHVEAYCGVRFATQTVVAKCDGFADMARVEVVPVQSVTSIEYVDSAGDAQTLSTDVYELRADGIEAAIVRKYNQTWPAIRLGSRITLTAEVGYATAPQDVRHAILMLVGTWYENREQVLVGDSVASLPTPIAVDALLANHRRGI